jgi:hypothetical protein
MLVLTTALVPVLAEPALHVGARETELPARQAHARKVATPRPTEHLARRDVEPIGYLAGTQ